MHYITPGNGRVALYVTKSMLAEPKTKTSAICTASVGDTHTFPMVSRNFEVKFNFTGRYAPSS